PRVRGRGGVRSPRRLVSRPSTSRGQTLPASFALTTLPAFICPPLPPCWVRLTEWTALAWRSSLAAIHAELPRYSTRPRSGSEPFPRVRLHRSRLKLFWSSAGFTERLR